MRAKFSKNYILTIGICAGKGALLPYQISAWYLYSVQRNLIKNGFRTDKRVDSKNGKIIEIYFSWNKLDCDYWNMCRLVNFKTMPNFSSTPLLSSEKIDCDIYTGRPGSHLIRVLTGGPEPLCKLSFCYEK